MAAIMLKYVHGFIDIPIKPADETNAKGAQISACPVCLESFEDLHSIQKGRVFVDMGCTAFDSGSAMHITCKKCYEAGREAVNQARKGTGNQDEQTHKFSECSICRKPEGDLNLPPDGQDQGISNLRQYQSLESLRLEDPHHSAVLMGSRLSREWRKQKKDWDEKVRNQQVQAGELPPITDWEDLVSTAPLPGHRRYVWIGGDEHNRRVEPRLHKLYNGDNPIPLAKQLKPNKGQPQNLTIETPQEELGPGQGFNVPPSPTSPTSGAGGSNRFAVYGLGAGGGGGGVPPPAGPPQRLVIVKVMRTFANLIHWTIYGSIAIAVLLAEKVGIVAMTILAAINSLAAAAVVAPIIVFTAVIHSPFCLRWDSAQKTFLTTPTYTRTINKIVAIGLRARGLLFPTIIAGCVGYASRFITSAIVNKLEPSKDPRQMWNS